MRILVLAVGRLKQGPETELVARYAKRALQSGRPLGFRDVEIVEIRESRAQEAERRIVEEGIAIANLIPEGSVAIALDGRGKSLTSEVFTAHLRDWRDAGTPVAVFLIGGADGLAPSLRDKAALTLAFGTATWPHQMVRIMLLEQLYRTMTLLAGHPYHRA